MTLESQNATAGRQLEAEHEVVVIGAGFSGIAVLRVLAAQGIDAHLLEAGDDVGGVWFWNRYPGVRCDAETFDYSFAFPEIDQEWEWHRRLAHGDEIQAHIAYTVDRYGLRDRIDFSQRVASARFDADSGRWTLQTESGSRYRARIVVWATGILSATQLPDIPGIQDFAGRVVHTADWPAGGVEVAGKRVGVIGTGSSGVQIIPELAKSAGELLVLQRTANHVVPANNVLLDEAFQTELRENALQRRSFARTTFSGSFMTASQQSALEVSEEERREVYERQWALGGFNMLRAFSDLATDAEAAATADAFVRAKIREVIEDPQIAEKLMPGDHPFNTKRMGVGIDYYETYNRPNVRLADARTEAIDRITSDGVQLSTGEQISLDILVCATGFDSFTGAMTRVDIRGRDGVSLAETWRDGGVTYLGLGVHGFPNLMMVNGPGSPSIFANAPIVAERAGEWIAELAIHLREHPRAALEPTLQAQQEWTEHLIDASEKTLYAKLRNTWYHGANTPGKRPMFTGYIGGANNWSARLAEVAADGYRGFTVTP